MKQFGESTVPLSQPALHILLALGDEAKHGYAIMQDIGVESEGKIRLLPGTLYSMIKKLLADKLLEEVDAPRGADSSDARRRYYRVTKAGRLAAEAEVRRLAMLVKMGRAFLS